MVKVSNEAGNYSPSRIRDVEEEGAQLKAPAKSANELLTEELVLEWSAGKRKDARSIIDVQASIEKRSFPSGTSLP